MDEGSINEYWEKENLDQYFPELLNDEGMSGNVLEQVEKAIPVDKEDLVRLHQLIRSRKSFTVLEFGVGYSTMIIADALMKNKQDWEALSTRPKIRNRFLFQCFSVDASAKWINISSDRLPDHLQGFVNFHFSKVEIGTHNGQLCHFYKSIPDIVPDFIYLDGPDPKMVEGNINGLSFQCNERTVMSGDLLLMEPTFLPGTFILVDGRTNNVRFLKNNFRREYNFDWDKKGDVSTFELKEERLGKYNLLGSDFFKDEA